MVNEAKAGKILAEKKLADANGKVSRLLPAYCMYCIICMYVCMYV